MENRSWAEGMDQATFNIEWVRRFKTSNLIPDVRTWVKPLSSSNKELPVSKPFSSSDLIRDFPADLIPNKEENEVNKEEKQGHLTAIYNCQYCKEPKKSKIGVISHERACKKRPAADPNSPEEIKKEKNLRTPVQCEHCSKVLKGLFNLKRHEKKCAHKRR